MRRIHRAARPHVSGRFALCVPGWRNLLCRGENGAARQGWQWRARLYKRGCTDHRHADLVVLLAVVGVRAVPFVIPVRDLPGRQCVITSDPERYAGRLAAFRQDTSIRL